MNKRIITCMILAVLLTTTAYSQFYAVRTDALGLATGTLNAELSIACHKRWTLHLPVAYNPWQLGDTQLKQITFQPGARYWLDQSYGYGWFAGAHLTLSKYDMAGSFTNNRRYDGMAYGAGFLIGFSLPIHRSWNVEFELGASAVYSKYDKYDCMSCDAKTLGENTYLIPTKVSISLLYLF